MAVDRLPELGLKPIALSVKLPTIKDHGSDRLGDGLRALYRSGAFTDVVLHCQEQSFPAHRVVLASQSEVFREGLHADAGQGSEGKQEVRIAEIANPEALKFMLHFMYRMDAETWEDYNPRTQEINKDVLRLAQNFRLPGLTDRAMHWLAKGVTTGNVVERLTICEEFGLSVLKERILEQLTFNKSALAEVAGSPQIMQHPRLMQAMLQLAAGVPEPRSTQEAASATAAPKKRAKKA